MMFLARGWLTPDLAADRAVDQGQQRGRHHDQGEPAGVRGGDKAGEVADHAAAQRDDRGVPVGASAPPARHRAATPARATCCLARRQRPRCAASIPTAAERRLKRLGQRKLLRDGRSVTIRALGGTPNPTSVRAESRTRERAETLGAPAGDDLISYGARPELDRSRGDSGQVGVASIAWARGERAGKRPSRVSRPIVTGRRRMHAQGGRAGGEIVRSRLDGSRAPFAIGSRCERRPGLID